MRAVAGVLQASLGLQSVTIWRRDANASTFSAISSPHQSRAALSLDDLPAPEPGAVRVPLLHGELRLGVLELEPAPGHSEPLPDLVEVLRNILAPYLDAQTLSEDLAFEVASRSREISEQRRFTGLIIDSLPVGLYVIDRDYRIQVWNRKRETGTQGLRRDLVVGRPVFEVLTRQPAQQLKGEFDHVFRTGEVQFLEIESGQGDDRRYYRLTRFPMRLDGEAVTHVVTIGEDVTEARLVQHQVLSSEKLAAVGQLAAGVMHEINNPLATIGAAVAAIQGRLGANEDPSVAEYLELIDHEVQRCTSIVDGLLDFSRPGDSGKPQSRTNLNALVEQTLFLLKHHKRFKRLNLVRELGPDLPPVLANGEQMVQVFMALFLNAVDAMEDGGRLTLRSHRTPARPEELVVEIQDTGHGIPPGQLSKIFEPFYTTKPPGRGTGLGLSICYGLVHEHRGRIEVESEQGRGTVFRVYLPALTDAAERP